MDYTGLWGTGGRTGAPTRLLLVVVLATTLVLIIAGVPLYFIRLEESDRTLLIEQAAHARMLAENLSVHISEEVSGIDDAGAAMVATISIMENIIAQQRDRTALFQTVFLILVAGGLPLVLAVSLLTIRDIARKYPELNEER